MKFLWCDTETTGIDTDKAAPIQIAFIFVYSKDGRKEEFERVFFLNPYDIPGIEHSKEAEEIHGYSKEQIENFPKSSDVVKQVYNCLCEYEKYRDHDCDSAENQGVSPDHAVPPCAQRWGLCRCHQGSEGHSAADLARKGSLPD